MIFFTLQISAGVIRRSGHEFKEAELEAVCGSGAARRCVSPTVQGVLVKLPLI